MDYSRNWKDLRVRTVVFISCWLGGFFLLILAMLLLGNKAMYLVPVWLIAFAVSGMRWTQFRCPRCNEHFFQPKGERNNQFRTTCAHCGLPKGSNQAD